jgi:hypothetical protein
MDREEFLSALRRATKGVGLSLPASLLKVLWTEIGVYDDAASICLDKNGHAEPNIALRTTEIVPFGREVDDYFDTEIKPHAADAWIDHARTKVGYEIPFTRLFIPLDIFVVHGSSVAKRMPSQLKLDPCRAFWSRLQARFTETVSRLPSILLCLPVGGGSGWGASFERGVRSEARTTFQRSQSRSKGRSQLSHVAKTADRDARRVVRAGDIVINSRSDRRGSSGLADRDGSVSVISIVLSPVG